jgi:hypothetical protein
VNLCARMWEAATEIRRYLISLRVVARKLLAEGTADTTRTVPANDFWDVCIITLKKSCYFGQVC